MKHEGVAVTRQVLRVPILVAVFAIIMAGGARLGAQTEPLQKANAGRSTRGMVHPILDLHSPARSAFPSDRFTLSDATMLTRRRVNLPLPDNCTANASECADTTLLNDLDGFNVLPRISIPFDGDIDLSTVKGNIFFVSIADASENWLASEDRRTDNRAPSLPKPSPALVIGINQIVWAPRERTLYAKADKMLDQHTRYALVVTTGVRAIDGSPIAPSPEFQRYRTLTSSANSEERWYGRALIIAEQIASRADLRGRRIAAISSFTTQSVTYLREKITRQILSAAAPDLPDFLLGPGGTRAVFPLVNIRALTHNQQTRTSGSLVPVNVDLAQLVPGAVGRIAFGRFLAPDYMVHPGEYIPQISSLSGNPTPQGTHALDFVLTLPAGSMPAGGWPVVIWGVGGNGNRIALISFVSAIAASHGLAVIAIENVGHGFGPNSTLAVTTDNGPAITIPLPGRGIDQDGDGVIGTAEGHNARAPRQLSLYADASSQQGADHLSLVRVIQRGIDVDDDGRRDVDPERIYFVGQSLGAAFGIPFVAYTQAVRASVFIVPFGVPPEARRLSPSFRPATGTLLAQRVPSLLNSEHGLTSLGGLPVTAPFFNENLPFRDQPPLTNAVPGALAIQEWLDRMQWRMQNSEPAAFAVCLRKNHSLAMTARPTLILLDRGDQGAPLVESGSIVRSGELEDRTVLYRHDLFYAKNPTAIRNSHNVYRFVGAATTPITEAIQQQFWEFLASDGRTLHQTSPYLETPMKSALPSEFDFVR